ncbi:TolC family protein [Flaviaesturariibacter flavus]|uniref:TolC family protein n=1 Tax=Flaviaesturariibacter flavus TaxID=2502780 RepID=A0A4R1B9B5_9BACT|nr:TolC family protein [Flaviaesturariibacter flavus]TCJ13493.1 TolC family protein [Flaviaesturariibacter flavus]
MTPKPKGGLLLLLLLAAATTAGAQQRYELTAKEAADLAGKNNVQVKSALIDVAMQEQTNREITANAYPQVNGNFGITYNPMVLAQRFPNFIALGTYGVLAQEGVKNGQGQAIALPSDVGFIEAAFGTKWNNNAGVSLQQLLFDGQVFVGLQARRASMDFARKAAELTEQGVRVNVYKVYYQLAAAKYQVRIIDANIARFQKLAADTRKIYDAGFAEKLDIDKVNVALNNLSTDRMRVMNQIDNGYLGLKLLMGIPSRDSIVLKDTVSYEQVRNEVLDATQFNYSDRKEVQYLEKGIELNKYNIKRYQYTYFPTVALSSNYSLLRQSDKFGFGGSWSKGASVGINVSVPIFDGFARAARVQRARLALQQSQNSLESLKLQIDNQVLTARNNFNNALAALDNQKRNLELAEKVYAQTRRKYEVGTGSQTEITAADTELRTAQNSYIAALYDAIVARIDFLNATGKLQ